MSIPDVKSSSFLIQVETTLTLECQVRVMVKGSGTRMSGSNPAHHFLPV